MGSNSPDTDPGDESEIDFSDKTIIVEGDSISVPVVVTPEQGWPSLFAASKGATLDNNAASGYKLTQGVTCGDHPSWDYTTVPVYNSEIHAALFIAFGANDIGLKGLSGMTREAFKTSLTTIVNYLHNTKLWPYAKIVLVTNYMITNYDAYLTHCGGGVDESMTLEWIEDFNDVYEEVATELHTCLASPYVAMRDSEEDPSTYMHTDGLHLNVVGHAFVASYMEGLSYIPE